MILMIFFLLLFIGLSLTLPALFKKAGKNPMHGYIPGLNFAVWCEVIGRSPWYALWLLFPIVNIFIYAGMAVDMVRSFGQYKYIDSAWSVIFAPFIFYRIGKDDQINYLGPNVIDEKNYNQKIAEALKEGKKGQAAKLQRQNPYAKSITREWVEALTFAIFAASFIRMFLIEAYTIPTSSMEGSLKVGDYLFVSKIHYGLRTPETLLQLPLLHNQIPILNKESYIKNPNLKQHRLPALVNVNRNDAVVFNWPVGDQVYITAQRSYNKDQVEREGLQNQVKNARYVERPMDKTDFYIKRCVGVAGDTLELIDKQLYVNGQAAQNPEMIQFLYRIEWPQNINRKTVEAIDIYPLDMQANGRIANLNSAQIKKIKDIGGIVTPFKLPQRDPIIFFPHDPSNFPGQDVDNFGPIWIPKAGVTVPLNLNNIALYKRIIDVYEKHDFDIRGNQIFIDGEPADSYTFAQDYYWMMGDNRHNSEDSRFWGFVPFDHVVGKPLFIWMSAKNGSIGQGIRWDRIFTSAQKM